MYAKTVCFDQTIAGIDAPIDLLSLANPEPTDHQRPAMDSTTCIELAIEGERLSKLGDFNGSVAFFEAAVKCGTNDLKTLSAIYSQLGNAYFYLANYQKAMDYHKLDLTVAKYVPTR